MKKHIFVFFTMLLYSLNANSQDVGIKTNLLYTAVTFTPNLALEVGLSNHLTLDIAGGYNPWNLNDDAQTKKLVHWLGELELRYWFCQKFSGLFIGVHGLGSQFNISGKKLPWLLGSDSQLYRYQGYGYGGGVSVGYALPIARRWNIEFNLGGGYARLNYDKYDCLKCGRIIDQNCGKNYWGITRAAVAISFLL